MDRWVAGRGVGGRSGFHALAILRPAGGGQRVWAAVWLPSLLQFFLRCEVHSNPGLTATLIIRGIIWRRLTAARTAGIDQAAALAYWLALAVLRVVVLLGGIHSRSVQMRISG